jgi:hypothetical protein
MRTRSLFFPLALAVASLGMSPEGGEVTLPLADYENLLRAVAPPEAPPELPPTLSAATLDITAADDVARAEMRFSARSEKAKASELPLGSGWPAETQTISPPSAILARRGGNLSLLLPGAGSWRVTLQASVPVDHEGDLATFQIPIPNFSAVEGSLAVPFANAEVKLSGGTILSRRTEAARTVVRFAASPGELSATIRAAGGHKTGPLKFGTSSIDTEEHVEENFLRSVSFVRLTLESGKAESVVFTLPSNTDVLRVPGDAVAGYEAKNGKLTVRLGASATADSPGIHFEIDLSRKFSTGKFEPPFPVLTTPATYLLAFYPSETLELSMEDAGSFEDADAAQANGVSPGADDIVIATATKTPTPPTYSCEKRKEGKVLALTIPEARFTTIASERGDVVTAAEYLVQTRSKTVLKVVLPPKAEFWEADERGKPIAAGRDTDGGLLLPLSSIRAKNRVRVLYRSPGSGWKEKQDVDLSLPSAAAPVSRANWSVTLPGDWNLTVPKDSSWSESGAPPGPESETADASENSEGAGFIAKHRGEAPGGRGAGRGIVISLPLAKPRYFSHSLLEGVPPALKLAVQRQRPEGDWR